MARYPNRHYVEEDYNPINSGIASVLPQTTVAPAAVSTQAVPTGWEEILARISSMQASPVDLRASMISNPNEVNPGPGSGRTNLAWGNVPGLERFYSYDAQNNQENFNLQEALPEIERLGYRVMQGFDPASETLGTWVVDANGKPIVQSAYLTGTNDDNFRIAAQLAQALVGGAVGNWAAAGNNAMSGGIGATAGTGAATTPVDVGGLSGWDAAMVDAANSGAITPQWMAGATVQPWDLPMDNPNWQPNPADYVGGDVAGIGATTNTPVVNVTAPAINTLPGTAVGAGIGSLPAAVDVFTGPGEQTVEVNTQREPTEPTEPTTPIVDVFPGTSEQIVEVEASRLPPENDPTVYPGDPFVDSIESNPTNNTNNTTTDTSTDRPIDEDAPTGQNDPHNDNLDPGGTGPTVVASPPENPWDPWKWIKDNPKLAIPLLGSLIGELGGDGSGGTGTGGTPPGGSQTDMTTTPAAPLGRRYIPPPPGYRPGFDPEHRYFTGIGTVGTGT